MAVKRRHKRLFKCTMKNARYTIAIVTIGGPLIVYSLWYSSLFTKSDDKQEKSLDQKKDKGSESSSDVISKKPHILFILADDYGYNDVGYHGSEIKTPTLDRLAKEGVRLENYYVAPICTPSRSQFMTGRYQIHLSMLHTYIHNNHTWGLPTGVPTLAEMLQTAGYATHLVGKWHLGHTKQEHFPTRRGFDSFYGFLGGSEDYFKKNTELSQTTKFGKPYKVTLHDFYNNTQVLCDRHVTSTYSTYLYVDRVEEIVNKHKPGDKPLFIFLSLQSPHGPLQAPEGHIHKQQHIKDSKRRTYAGMVSAMDEAVDRVTQIFKKAKLWQNTVLVFSSDNGGIPLIGGNNWPLRGTKGTLFEGGVRAVGFVNSPLLQKSGYENHQLYHITDWFPTFLHLAGRPDLSRSLPLDGFNIWHSINSKSTSPRREILLDIDQYSPLHGEKNTKATFDTRIRGGIRKGKWKVITGLPSQYDWAKYIQKNQHFWFPPPHMGPQNRTIISEPTDKNVWLFNIDEDPNEKTDLSGQEPDILDSLLHSLHQYSMKSSSKIKLEPFSSLYSQPWGDGTCGYRRVLV